MVSARKSSKRTRAKLHIALHCVAAAWMLGGLPAGAQRITKDSAIVIGRLVVPTGPTVVLFHQAGGDGHVDAEARAQYNRMQSALEASGITILERATSDVTFVFAGAQVLWSVPRDSARAGYVFARRSGIDYIRYGLVPDSTLRAAIDRWWPPSLRKAP